MRSYLLGALIVAVGCAGDEGSGHDPGLALGDTPIPTSSEYLAPPDEGRRNGTQDTPDAQNWHRWYPMFRGQLPGKYWSNPWQKPDSCMPANTGQLIYRHPQAPAGYPEFETEGQRRTFYQNYSQNSGHPSVVNQLITLSADGRDLEHWGAGRGDGVDLQAFLNGETHRYYRAWGIHYVFPSTGTALENTDGPTTNAMKAAFASCTKAYFDSHPEVDWNAWLLDPQNRAPRKLRLPQDANGAVARGNYTCELAFVSGWSPTSLDMIYWPLSGPRAQDSKQLASVSTGKFHHRVLENINYRYILPDSAPLWWANMDSAHCPDGEECWWQFSSEVYTLTEVEEFIEDSPTDALPKDPHKGLPPAFTDYHCVKFNKTAVPDNPGMLCENTCDPNTDPWCEPACDPNHPSCKPNLQYKACDGDTDFNDMILY